MQHHGLGVWLLTSHKWQRKGVLNKIGGWLSLVLPHHIKSYYQGFTGDIARSNDTCPSLVALWLSLTYSVAEIPRSNPQIINNMLCWICLWDDWMCAHWIYRIILEKGQALCVAQKIQMAFKHYPSTCSNTCAGASVWRFPRRRTLSPKTLKPKTLNLKT